MLRSSCRVNFNQAPSASDLTLPHQVEFDRAHSVLVKTATICYIRLKLNIMNQDRGVVYEVCSL